MDKETRNRPPILQKPYNLYFKHTTWVQKEFEALEKAGIIIQSVSPWASLIMVVLKLSQPGQPSMQKVVLGLPSIKQFASTSN